MSAVPCSGGRALPTCETWMPVSGKIKVYPCAIVISHWEDGTTLWSQGHHKPSVFVDEAVREWMEEMGDDRKFVPNMVGTDVEYEWWATRQWGGMTGRGAEYKFVYHITDPWANGAYPVSVIRL